MVKFVFITLLSFLITSLAVVKGDDAERERRVKVAIALSATAEQTETPVVESAPTPKAKTLPTYVEGYTQAVDRSKVLVVYVGCEGSHPIEAIPGCVVAVQKELPPYTKGTIVIAYPVADKLLVHKLMKCEDHKAVAKEAEVAIKKLDPQQKPPVTDIPLAKPLDWSLISATITVDCCTWCKGDCKCADKSKCPNSCLVAAEPTCNSCSNCKCEKKCDGSNCLVDKKVEPKQTQAVYDPTLPQIAGYWSYRNPDGTAQYVQWPVTVASSCANGRCNLPK